MAENIYNAANILRVPIRSQSRLLTGPANHSQISEITQHPLENISERLWPKLMETVKGKLSQGAKILKVTRTEKLFKKNFNATPVEKLVKAVRCELQTTAGPIAGLLFISTERIAFYSDKPIKISSHSGELLKFHYKVMIPLRKIKRAIESKSLKKPSEKYIQVVTKDNFEFWFMGLFNHQRFLRYLQETISQTCAHIFHTDNTAKYRYPCKLSEFKGDELDKISRSGLINVEYELAH